MLGKRQNQQLSDQFLNDLSTMSTEVVRNNFFELFNQALNIEEQESQVQNMREIPHTIGKKTVKLMEIISEELPR